MAPRLPFEPGEVPPRAVVWLHPWELLRTAYRSMLSTAATGFLDRRETLPALRRTNEEPADSQPGVLRPADDGTLEVDLQSGDELWIDYVADIGDSWDATYATTKLIAQSKLEVSGLPKPPLPGAHIVAVGGDLVYPWPSRDSYRTRTRSAFTAALPEQPERAPSLVAIPGNHDWYDGLTSFVREFCQGGMLGGWRLDQTRSYFAAKLSSDWWLWGIDIALDARIDSPQQRYFLDVLSKERGVRPLMNIILCTAKPVWLDDPRHSTDAYNNLAYFAELVRRHGAAIPVMLAGDLHHYSRFENPSGEQMIVCGGGGAYLAATHQVPLRVPRVEGQRSHLAAGEQHQRARKAVTRENAVDPQKEQADRQFRASEYCYPSRDESRRLAYGGFLLARRYEHLPFLLFLGVVYALFAFSPAHPISGVLVGSRADFGLRLRDALAEPLPWRASLSAIFILLVCTSYAASASLHGSWPLRIVWGTLHGVAHLALALFVFTLFGYPVLHLTLASFGTWIPQSFAYMPVASWTRLLAYIVLAGAAGITLLGAYLVVSDRMFGWHTNELFSFQGIYDYRSFLRMRLDKEGCLTIYPIGLQRVPRRWRARAAAPRDPAPMDETSPGLYEPGDAVLRPHAIEAPITIRPSRTA